MVRLLASIALAVCLSFQALSEISALSEVPALLERWGADRFVSWE